MRDVDSYLYIFCQYNRGFVVFCLLFLFHLTPSSTHAARAQPLLVAHSGEIDEDGDDEENDVDVEVEVDAAERVETIDWRTWSCNESSKPASSSPSASNLASLFPYCGICCGCGTSSVVGMVAPRLPAVTCGNKGDKPAVVEGGTGCELGSGSG